MPDNREEQRERLRAERVPDPQVLVLRGGPDRLEKLRMHARRTARAWNLDGLPLFGVSVFCVLDDIGLASVDGLVAVRLRTYKKIHVCTVADLATAGVALLPTGTRPHFTAVLESDDDEQLRALLATFGPPRDTRGGAIEPRMRGGDSHDHG